MISAAMGTGKTAMAIAIANETQAKLALILCPLRVAQVWRAQIARFTDGPCDVVVLDESFANARAKCEEAKRCIELARLRGNPVFVVINYESFWREPFLEWALTQIWDLIIADEIHRCKAANGKASRSLARLGKRTRFRVGLSGTPMPHSPLDVFGYYRFLDESLFGWSYFKFRQHYAVLGGFQNRQIIAYANLDELNQKFYSIAASVAKDVLDLPPEMHVTYSCKLGSNARSIYRALERDLVAEVQSGQITASNALVKLLRLQQIASGFARTDEGDCLPVDTAKVSLLREILEDLGPDEAVVIFGRFLYDLDSIAQLARDLGRGSLELSGRVDQLQRWQTGEVPILAVQIDSGGLGVDLTRARYAIYFSMGFSLGSYEQSLARIHRPGQTRPVEYIHLLAENTVDEKVMTALSRRANVVNAVLQDMNHGPQIPKTNDNHEG
jgi:SNF2 family DNA or RNA helicase